MSQEAVRVVVVDTPSQEYPQQSVTHTVDGCFGSKSETSQPQPHQGQRQPCLGQEASKRNRPIQQQHNLSRQHYGDNSVRQSHSLSNHNAQQQPQCKTEMGTRPAPQGAPSLQSASTPGAGVKVSTSPWVPAVAADRSSSHVVSFSHVSNGCLEQSDDNTGISQSSDDDGQVRMRHTSGHHPIRHAHSEAETDAVSSSRRRSQSMAEIKVHAYQRLQEELNKAQTELRLKDEECEKLSKVRDQMEQELDDLTASLFEEANKMVQEANVKRMHTEKLLDESNQKIEMLQAEVVALKQLVLTSTPSTPNKHLHPQIAEVKDKKSSKPFWKTHRRSTSHHEFTKESRQAAEAQSAQGPVHCKEMDTVCFEEFVQWRHDPDMNSSCPFLARIILEDITPCLNFTNKKLAKRVQQCVDRNTLMIEPIPGDNSYPRKCSLTETNKLCNYKIKLEEDHEWYSISQLCRNRIASVCDFYTYIRYIHQGLVRTAADKEVFLEIVRLRKQMALSRLGII